jgi:hypothetical protein
VVKIELAEAEIRAVTGVVVANDGLERRFLALGGGETEECNVRRYSNTSSSFVAFTKRTEVLLCVASSAKCASPHSILALSL